MNGLDILRVGLEIIRSKRENMETINGVILIGSLITAVGVIIAAMKKLLDKILEPIVQKIDNMDERQCKVFLVDFLNDLEHGLYKDEVQFKFAHEVYDHYINDLHGNSYVHDKWERVMNG